MSYAPSGNYFGRARGFKPSAQSREHLVPGADFLRQRRQVALFPEAALVLYLRQTALFPGHVEQGDDGQMALQEVRQPAAGRVPGILVFALAGPAPAGELGFEGLRLPVHGGQIQAEADVAGLAAFTQPSREGENPAGRHADGVIGCDVHGPAGLDEQPAQRIVLTAVVKIALIAGRSTMGPRCWKGKSWAAWCSTWMVNPMLGFLSVQD